MLFAEWLPHVEQDRSPTTYAEYQRLVDKRINPALGDVRLKDLTPDHLERFYRSIIKPNGSLSRSSVERIHNVIRKALNVAMRWEWVTRNVAQLAELPAGERPMPSRLADDEIVAQLIRSAFSHDQDLGVLLIVSAVTGARRGEVCGLRWDRVDLARGVVTIDRAIVQVQDKPLIEKGTKTHQAREVHIDEDTVALLAAHRATMEERAELCGVTIKHDAYVWSRAADCSQPLKPSLVSQAWLRTRRKVPGAEGVRLHDLRHWSASILADDGHSMIVVKERLGHRQLSTTDRYAHGVRGRDREAGAALGARLHQKLELER